MITLHKVSWRMVISMLAAGIVAGVFTLNSVEAQSPRNTDGVLAPVDVDGGKFLGNVGQWDVDADYLLRNGSLDVWLTGESIVYQMVDTGGLNDPVGEQPIAEPVEPGDEIVELEFDYHVVRANLLGADPEVRHEQIGLVPGVFNYLQGNLNATGARASTNVVYRGIYPGIDMIVSSVAANAEIDGAPIMKVSYELAPGADPGAIVIDYEGADAVSVRPDGSLLIETSLGDIIERAPIAWQQVNGELRGVSIGFELDGTQVSFNVGPYNNTVPLTIDPSIIYSSAFLSGNSSDYVAEMHEDASGRYFTGHTFSTTFPTTSGAFREVATGTPELFAVKMSLDQQT